MSLVTVDLEGSTSYNRRWPVVTEQLDHLHVVMISLQVRAHGFDVDCQYVQPR